MVKVFDLDGTILDSNGIWRQVDEIFVGRYGFELTDEYNEYAAHAIFPDAAQLTKAYYHLDVTEKEIMSAWYELAYNAYAEQLQLKPGVREYLEQCAAQGERMVLYTSSEPSLCKAALAHHQLTSFFEQLFFAQELGWEKKYSASFLQLSLRLGEPPEQCLLLDDSPLACTSAKNAGWQVVGVLDPFFSHQSDQMKRLCDRVIADFSQLLSE